MGHTDTKMIMQVYAHLDDEKEQTSEKINACIKMAWFLTTFWLHYLKKSASDYTLTTEKIKNFSILSQTKKQRQAFNLKYFPPFPL